MNEILAKLLGTASLGNKMPRFEYDRLTGGELDVALRELDLPPYGFARIFGTRANVVKKWLRDEQDIPAWVFVAIALLRQPGALSAARQAAAQHIRVDNRYPNRGQYPYERGGDLMEASDDDD